MGRSHRRPTNPQTWSLPWGLNHPQGFLFRLGYTQASGFGKSASDYQKIYSPSQAGSIRLPLAGFGSTIRAVSESWTSGWAVKLIC